MIDVRSYQREDGSTPFRDWFHALDTAAAKRVDDALGRMELGNLGDHKPVGQGVFERCIDFGPGYRVYFGRDGNRLVILLAGGTKKRQSQDITRAQTLWKEYKRRKRQKRKGKARKQTHRN
jgi:putative addiction module killer protein